MGYRIELVAADTTTPMHLGVCEQRFPNFVSAIVAARNGVRQLREELVAPVTVSIFDRQERLASRMSLIGYEVA